MQLLNVKYLLLTMLLLFISVLPTNSLAAQQKTPLKVGFVLTGPAKTLGWELAHDEGRRYLEKALAGRVQTILVENVPENAEVERVMEKLVAQGTKLIFSTSFGFFEPMLRVATRHPDVIFMQCQRYSTAKNVGTYFANSAEALYVAGFVSGKMTKKHKLGYIGGHPIPTIISCVNAFAMGARTANPKVRVQVAWTNSWSDPVSAAEATRSLLESGADVIVAALDSCATCVQTAEKKNAYSVVASADLHKLAPKGWLVGQIWNWGPLYVKTAQAVLDGTWKASNDLYAMKSGYVDLSSFGSAVPSVMQKEAYAIKEKIIKGQLVVFKGPLKDKDGKERIPAGRMAGTKELETMNWFVENVDGSLH